MDTNPEERELERTAQREREVCGLGNSRAFVFAPKSPYFKVEVVCQVISTGPYAAAIGYNTE